MTLVSVVHTLEGTVTGGSMLTPAEHAAQLWKDEGWNVRSWADGDECSGTTVHTICGRVSGWKVTVQFSDDRPTTVDLDFIVPRGARTGSEHASPVIHVGESAHFTEDLRAACRAIGAEVVTKGVVRERYVMGVRRNWPIEPAELTRIVGPLVEILDVAERRGVAKKPRVSRAERFRDGGGVRGVRARLRPR